MNSRQKGKRGELELANHLKAKGYDARRGVQYKGGPESPDVTGLPGVHIEVKRTEALRLYEALDQSTRDRGQGEIPVVVHRKSRMPWVVILTLDDFLKIYEGRK